MRTQTETTRKLVSIMYNDCVPYVFDYNYEVRLFCVYPFLLDKLKWHIVFCKILSFYNKKCQIYYYRSRNYGFFTWYLKLSVLLCYAGSISTIIVTPVRKYLRLRKYWL